MGLNAHCLLKFMCGFGFLRLSSTKLRKVNVVSGGIQQLGACNCQLVNCWYCSWSGNSSAISREVDSAQSSQLVFTPRTETQYGSMWCSANNSVGTGPPCVYIILPPGLTTYSPACFALNITTRSFQVGRETTQRGMMMRRRNDKCDAIKRIGPEPTRPIVKLYSSIHCIALLQSQCAGRMQGQSRGESCQYQR